MDIFRHLGRAQLSSFAGGAPANRAFDRADVDGRALHRGRPPAPDRGCGRAASRQESDELRDDLAQYVAGINAYIAEARLNPRRCPASTPRSTTRRARTTGSPPTSSPPRASSGAIFGVGGGEELDSALVLRGGAQALRAHARRRASGATSARVDDPESPTIVHGGRFPYGLPPRRRRGAGAARPRVGPQARRRRRRRGSAAPSARRGAAPGLVAFPRASRTRCSSRRANRRSGRPLAVFGPADRATSRRRSLMEQDVHAPGIARSRRRLPRCQPLRADRPRPRLRLERDDVRAGHRRHLRGRRCASRAAGRPTLASMHYRFRGRCLPIEVLERTNDWSPTRRTRRRPAARRCGPSARASGSWSARATIHGRPVVYTRLRSTYRHEPDAGLAFSYLNDPGRINGPADFQRDRPR